MRARLSIIAFAVSLSVFAAGRSAWDGVYTKEQANRGRTAYNAECLKCHAENLAGGEAAPALVGEEFLQKWNGKTAGALFELMRKTMPSDDPGGLSSRQYSDMLAYILSANKFPAGEKELDRELASLNEIRIETKK
jgi:S-disulfanyl-L-cysteine oxidoreductase SoxD